MAQKTSDEICAEMDAASMAWSLREHADYQGQYGGLIVPAVQLKRAAELLDKYAKLLGENQ